MGSIWFQKPTLDQLQKRSANTLVDNLGIKFTELGDDFFEGEMPVDQRTKQPAGLLHGGASVALAETLSSIAGNLVVDPSLYYCVGLEINANHVRACKDGVVAGVTRALHIGKTTQVWETKISQNERLVCISRITLAVVQRATRPSRKTALCRDDL